MVLGMPSSPYRCQWRSMHPGATLCRIIDVDTALSFQMHERYIAQTEAASGCQRLGELAEGT